MTPSASIGRRGRRPLLSAAAALAVLGATLVAATFPATPAGAAGGSISVAPNVGLDPDGDSVRVTGSGWDPSIGIYVMFCHYEGSRPSAGPDCGDNLWISNIPGASAAWTAEGGFSVDLSVQATIGENGWDCTDPAEACGVFVRRDHMGGSQDLSFDGFSAIEFAEPVTPGEPEEPEEPEAPEAPGSENSAAISLSKDTDLADGEAVTVTGTGYTPDQGIYVQFCAAPTGTIGTAGGRTLACYAEQDGLHTVWHTPVAADGRFVTPLTVAASFVTAEGTTIDCKVESCGVFTRRDHNGGSSDFSQDAFAPVTIGDGVVDPGAVQPTLTAKRSSGLDPRGDQVELHGAGFPADVALFVAVCDVNVSNFAACDFDHAEEVVPNANPTRSAGFLLTLPVRAIFGSTNCTEEGTECAVHTWAVSGDNTAVETSLPISFAGSISRPDDSGPGSGAGGGTPPSSRPGVLPRTGIQTDGMAVAGLMAIGLGAVMVAASRRRTAA